MALPTASPDELEPRPPRILALDILRGYFIAVIVIDHLQRFPGLFDLATGRGQLWVSAAEGFFFISGMVLAIVRGYDMRRIGFRAVAVKVWSRSFLLYIWSVALTIGFTYIAFALAGNPNLKSGLIGQTGFGEILSDAVLLRYSYGWADFLPHYVVFLAAAPIILVLLQRGLGWFVALASLTMWAVGPASLFDARWQMVFVAGMLGGHYMPVLESRFRQFSTSTRRRLRIVIVVTALGAILASALIVIVRSPIMAAGWPVGADLDRLNTLLAPVFDKNSMTLPRVGLFLLCFTALYLVARRFESRILRWVGWLLVPLGRNSLYVYILHSIILFFLPLAIPLGTGLWANIVINTAVIGLLWLCVRRQLFFSIIPR